MSAGNKHKAKGTAYEKLIHDGLVALGLNAERMGNYGKDHGNEDVGDIHLRSGFGTIVIQAKNRKQHNVGQWLREAGEQAARVPGAPLPVVVYKLRGQPAFLDQVVSMRMETLVRMLAMEML